MEDRKITVTLQDGTKTEGEILFTFEANGDHFVLYKIEHEAFGAKIMEDNSLKQVEDDEWKLIEKVFNEYQEGLEEDE